MPLQSPTPPPALNQSWNYVPATSSTPAHYVYPLPLQKARRDDRTFRVIRLENGLQAVLVHDPNTDKAAASLNVGVGHLQDPDNVPGMAHFCEHLLFMGTKQFPKENEYSEFLSKNGGQSNAYTAASNTNYYFSVGKNAFAGALERFSGFFHSPLFSPSCTTRELNAVESEHQKNLQNDVWRIFQLNKHLTKPDHPWKKFGSGNKASITASGRTQRTDVLAEKNEKANTLQPPLPSPVSSRSPSPTPSNHSGNSEAEADGGTTGRETRRQLVEWWSKEYCANRMSLSLLGRESLDELTRLATTLFSPIPNRGRDATSIPDHPFGPTEMGTLVYVKTIMDFHAFELSFPLPYQAPHWRSKPAHFLAHFIGHEGPGSLHSYLKHKGWNTSLSAGPQSLAQDFAMFKITVYLTNDGFKNYKAAILACFKYLTLLRNSEFPLWNFQETVSLSNMRFEFEEKRKPEAYVTAISEGLHWPYPREHVFNGQKLVWEWDEAEVRRILDSFTVDRGRVVVMARNHDSLGEDTSWEREPWYKTEYVVQKIDDKFASQARANNDIPELFLPKPNEFIPTNLDVYEREVAHPLKRPVLVKQSPITSTWHKRDDQFWVPKANVTLKILSPLANDTARNSVMTRLYIDLVNDALTEYAYDADLAGLVYDCDSHKQGITISVEGYNDKLGVLARHVVEKLKNLVINPERLEVMKEQLRLEWNNFFIGQTFRVSDYWGRYLLTHHAWSVPDKLKEIASVRPDEVCSHASNLLSRVSVDVLVNGNLHKDEAIGIADAVENILDPSPLPQSERPPDRSLILPQGCNYVLQKPVPNANEPNGSITYYCHVGDFSNPRIRVVSRFMAHLLSEPAFNVLRTKEQLGYVVFASSWEAVNSIGIRILIQSEKKPGYLESRVDAFLVGFQESLRAMSAADFEEQRQGLVNKWQEKLKNLSEESKQFWSHIKSGYLDFMQRERDALILQTITRDEVLALFSQRIDPASPTRSKISVHMLSQKLKPRKFSVAASQSFLELLRTNEIPVDEDQYTALSTAEPPVIAVKGHWSEVLRGHKFAMGLLQAIDELAEKHPTSDEDAPLRDDAITIQDPDVFRASLEVSGPAQPVEEFHDLPLSRF